MGRVKAKIVNDSLRLLWKTEAMLNRGFVFARKRLRVTTESTAPNDPHGWERIYLSRVTPVTAVTSEIACSIQGLTFAGESLLETGCGGGSVSAELAVAKRRVAVCDFSQPILDRVTRLFAASELPAPETYLVDLTRPLPFPDDRFDVIWSSGVLEHWTDAELRPIIAELARCAKRCVIALVPNERCLLYRYGREMAELHGISPWGRELPRSSLRHLFEGAGLCNVTETTICLKEAPKLINILDPVFSEKLLSWWDSVPDIDAVKDRQGYLLLTVGYRR